MNKNQNTSLYRGAILKTLLRNSYVIEIKKHSFDSVCHFEDVLKSCDANNILLL